MNAQIQLGTANWGLKTTKTESFRILDFFYEEGLTLIDTATNYPINGDRSDQGLALSWIEEWLCKNPASALKVFIKIGSVSNTRSETYDLSTKTIRTCVNNLRSQLGGSINGIGIHWDNRDIKDKNYISETIRELKTSIPNGVMCGLSGIRNPPAYAATGLVDSDWVIQVKEYLGNTLSRNSYEKYFPKNPYVAYGLSHYLSTFKIIKEQEKKDLYFRAIDYMMSCNKLTGFIVGPSNLNQAMEVVNYFKSVSSKNF